MINEVIADAKDRMDKAIEALRHDLMTIRTGRATPALVEHLMIEYYGTPTPLQQLATISIPEAQQIMIRPYTRGDIQAIEKMLPHRYPFLLIDKIIDFKMDESVVGVKNVTANEPFFEGHFPGQPVMPGVLILEGMAQTGGILLLNGIDNPTGRLVFFMSIDNAKFRRPVTPGDQLVFQLTMTNRKKKICQMHGEAFVDGVLVAEADMMASLIDRAEVKGAS